MLSLENRGHVRLLTLDRPEKSNALHPDLIARLSRALEETAADRDVRVIVLTGRGKRFCAGLDLRHLASLDVDGRIEYMGSLFAIFRQLGEIPQPVIAAVNGPAIAGGFDIAAFCDLRVCGTSATFGQAEILLGLTQVAYPLYKVIGLSRATELALLGEAIDAAEAYEFGLVSRVYADDELLPQALELATRMAERPPEALFETKRLTRQVTSPDTDAAFTMMFEAISARLRAEEHQQALAAYMEQLARR